MALGLDFPPLQFTVRHNTTAKHCKGLISFLFIFLSFIYRTMKEGDLVISHQPECAAIIKWLFQFRLVYTVYWIMSCLDKITKSWWPSSNKWKTLSHLNSLRWESVTLTNYSPPIIQNKSRYIKLTIIVFLKSKNMAKIGRNTYFSPKNMFWEEIYAYCMHKKVF